MLCSRTKLLNGYHSDTSSSSNNDETPILQDSIPGISTSSSKDDETPILQDSISGN